MRNVHPNKIGTNIKRKKEITTAIACILAEIVVNVFVISEGNIPHNIHPKIAYIIIITMAILKVLSVHKFLSLKSIYVV